MINAGNLACIAKLSALLFLGCMAGTEDEPKPGPGAGIEANLRKWNRSKPENYAFELRRQCYCEPKVQGPFLVTASKDSVLSVKQIMDAGDTLDVDQGQSGYSIEAVFADLASRVKAEHEVTSLHFDAKNGFPDSAFFDWREDFHDDEYGLKLKMINP